MHAQKNLPWLLAALLSSAMAGPTVYLAGDSTMTSKGNNDGTQGWGAYLPDYLNLPVVNSAIAGRSARSFTREGRFAVMAEKVTSGDYVVIEFGHNDAGSLTPTDNGRSDCTPINNDYSTTCSTTYNGVAETVLTMQAYLVNAAKLFQDKGANVIISSQTPNNVWETGTYSWSSPRFATYAKDAAAAVGATYVDHGYYVAAAYKSAGATTVNSYYPNDHTHTSPAGAKVVAYSFVRALAVTDSPMKAYSKL